MTLENLQTVIVILFDCEHRTVTWISNKLELPYDFVSDTIIEWWQLMDERDWEEEKEWRRSRQ